MKKIASLMLVALPLLLVVIGYTAAQGPTPRPDFAITCDRGTIPAPPGETVKYDLTITPINGFRGEIELACMPTPRVSCSLPVEHIKVGADLNVGFSVVAASEPTITPGTYPIVVSAKGTPGSLKGTVSHSHQLFLSVVKASIKP